MERRRLLVGAVLSPLAGSAWWSSAALAQPPQNGDWERRVADLQRAMLESFPYPTVRVAGVKALETWERMRSDQGSPIILGGKEEFFRVAETLSAARESGRTPETILAEASRFTFPDDFRARRRREEAALQERLRTDPNMQRFADSMRAAGISSYSEPSRGPWPSQPPGDPGLTVQDQLVVSGAIATMRPHDEVIIATLPTQDWTEAFAYLGFGGWNACPYPHEQVAAFRHWNARYGLVLAGLSGDVLNLRASRAPKTRDDALSLAREQYEFCPDIVDQGVETLDALAAGLMTNAWWYFWWD